MTWFKQLQEEQKVWVEKNFPGRATWMPLLGLVEESCAELAEAYETGKAADITDAIGDIMVFMSDFCTGMNFDLHTIVEEAHQARDRRDQSDDIAINIGRLAHSYLKKAQGIRGTPEEHDENMKQALVGIVHELVILCEDSTEFSEDNLEDIVRPVWEKVRQRDWTKTRKPGDPMFQSKPA